MERRRKRIRGKKPNRRKLRQRPIICNRVSTPPQVKNGNLDDQQFKMIKYATRHVGGFVAAFEYCGPGYEVERWAEAVELAKETGAPLFFESTDRMIRAKAYHQNKNPNAQPTKEEWKKLYQVLDGVKVVFLNEGTPSEIRNFQAKRGQAAKGNSGGRPKINKAGYKKEWRLQNKIKVWWLVRLGFKPPEIAKLLDIKRDTVHKWIKRKDTQ